MRKKTTISLGLLLVIFVFSVPIQARDNHKRSLKEQVLDARVYDADEFRDNPNTYPPANARERKVQRGEVEREDATEDRAKPGYRNETDDSGFVLGGPQDQDMDGVTIQFVIRW